MSIRSIRFSKKVRNQLVRLKRKTGIPTYNVLCRWALCHSLSDARIPKLRESKTTNKRELPVDESFEDCNTLDIDWRVLGGEYSDLFVAVIKQNCLENGINIDKESIYDQIKLHTVNGIRQLVANDEIKNIESLLSVGLPSNVKES